MVFELNEDNTKRPEGISRLFYQQCWDIIGDVVTKIVKAFFFGYQLPRYITHTIWYFSLVYPTKVLRKFDFSDIIIDMVWRLVDSNWYSVLVDDQSYEFFQSTRGVKQGDPLSLVLLIIAAEVILIVLITYT